ncbi:tetratricopeptide repeat protein, partial [bacterium]|nr:tetratricopeptide repeat protein [bacterium]
HYRKALVQDPKQSNAAAGLSSILRKQNESEAALEILLNALKQNPDSNNINFELANVYYDLRRLEEAYESLCSCLKFEPKQSGIWNNIGYLMAESGKLEKATECYRKALSIDPGLIESRTNLIWQMAQTCSWQERDKLLKKCKFLPPLTSVILENNPHRNLICAKNAVEKLKKETQVMPHQTNKKQGENYLIRIGYLSCDFRDHPVAHNILNLFRLHDRKRFHITAYSCGPSDNSSYRQQISKDCDRFVDLNKLNDYDCAKKIHADKIDILIELMGHTRENRLGIMAYRPAPIQVSYLGYPGTTGADFIDYIIADEIVIPPKHKIHFSEEVINLNDCFMIADRAPIGPSPKRSAFGLPEKGFIFCSFNSPFKIEPVMFKVWMDIMTAIPDSYLWLREASERYETNLKNESKKHNIDPKRLIFAPRTTEKGDHLARLGLAGLALDTRIYNGHTKTLDALWAGVPVLTCKGRHFASLVSDSNLKAIGLSELSVPDLETYRETAIDLAKNPERLKIIRQKLAARRLTTPLFDTERTVRNLEEAYMKIWNKRKEKLKQ